MRLQDFKMSFWRNLRSNPRKKVIIPNIDKLSRRAALGESWSKLAQESGVTPRLLTTRVQEYRFRNFTTDSVLEDIKLERASGKDWLQVATRAGWPTDSESVLRFAEEFTRLTDTEPAPEKTKEQGQSTEQLSASAYDDFCDGRKTLEEIAAENNMSTATAQERLLALAGPDITDIKSLVRKKPVLDVEEAEEAEEIAEALIDDIQEVVDAGEILGSSVLPWYYWRKEELMEYILDEETSDAQIMELWELTPDDIRFIVAIDLMPEARARHLESLIEGADSIIEDAIKRESRKVQPTPVKRPAISVQEPAEPPEPVTIASVLPAFETPKPTPSKKRRGRKKKEFDFSAEEREFIRASHYDNRRDTWIIARELSKQRGEKVTQTAVKEIIKEYSQGRGRRSTLDREALERDARRNLAVSTLANMHNVSVPTIVKALKEMGIKPIYSLDKEMRMKKLSDEEIAESRRKYLEVQLQVDTILSDPARRQDIKEAYLRSNLTAENDVAVLGASEGISTYNMARVLTDIFEDEIRRLRDRDRVDELVAEYGADQLRKIQRDLIDRRTLHLRGNPYDETSLNMYVVPGAQGVAAGLVVDQAMRHFYPEASPNKRNLTSGAIVASVCAADYMYQKDEKKLWRAAGGVAGVLISRFIESKFQKKG